MTTLIVNIVVEDRCFHATTMPAKLSNYQKLLTRMCEVSPRNLDATSLFAVRIISRSLRAARLMRSVRVTSWKPGDLRNQQLLLIVVHKVTWSYAVDFIAHLAIGTILLSGSVAHSVHIDRDEKDGRVGVRVDYSSGKIQHVYKDSPAMYAGIRKGDVVLTVDGATKACRKIHGLPGTSVHLQLTRANEEPYELDVMRAECNAFGKF